MNTQFVAYDPHRETTILDCLDAFAGGVLDDPDSVHRLSDSDVQTLVERLTDFYAVWRPPVADKDAIRFSLASTKLLEPSLLYANSIVVEDPVFAWLVEMIGELVSLGHQFNEPWTSRLERVQREELARAVMFLNRWRLLLARGWVIASPRRFDRFYGFQALLRAPPGEDPAMARAWEWLLEWADAGNTLSPTERRVLDAGYARFLAANEARDDREFAAHMRTRLSVTADDHLYAIVSEYIDALDQANGARARPLASSVGEWEYLLHRLRTAEAVFAKNDRTALSIIPAISASELPFLHDLSPQDLLSVRATEPAFAEWQLTLSRAVRGIELLPSEANFADEAASVLRETLLPAAEEIRVATSRTRALASSAKESVVKLGLGAVVGAGAKEAGLPLDYSIVAAGFSSLVDLTVRAVLGPSVPTSQQTVLAKLVALGRRAS
jgi:hypothetical protein